MAITYPINPDTDRFCVYDTASSAPLKDGRGRDMRNVRWGSNDLTQMIPGLADSVRWLLEIKESKPTFDQWTEKLEKTTTFDVVNETVTEGWNVVALTAEEQDARLGDYFTTSGGIKLKTDEASQAAFTSLITLLNESGAPPEHQVTVKDVKGDAHTIDLATLRTDLVAYGTHCYTQFLA